MDISNISSIITKNAYIQPHEKALICGEDGMTFTWLELDQIINKFSNALKYIGVKKGDVVSLYLPNWPEFIISYFAVTRVGAVILPFNILFRTDEISYILNNSRTKILIGASEEIKKYLLPVKDRFPYLENIIAVGEDAPNCLNFHSLISNASSHLDPVECDPEDLACLVYTSGTSGNPKGVMLTHNNLEAIGALSSIALYINDKDLLLTGAPFCHICFVLSVIGPFKVGAGVVTMQHFSPRRTLELISRYRITHFTGVPTMFIYMLEEFKKNKYDLRSLRLVYSAGAAMPVQYIEEIKQKFGVGFIELYGATETSSIVSYNRLGHEKKGSAGQPAYGIQVKVVDKAGKELPTGEIGEIVVKGPGIFRGYWEMPEATRDAFYDGWYRTGDIGKLDEDGYLYIVDRLKEMIISGGYNVYPREVEDILYQHPMVAEVAVIGQKDPLYSEVPKAFVRLRDEASTTESELINFCRQRMAAYKVPRFIEFVSELPKSPTGKILKRELMTS